MQDLLQRELSGTEFVQDQGVRREIAKTFEGFCLTYLSHYFTLEPPTYGHEMLATIADDDLRILEVIGYRGSAKSTFGTTAYVLYAALEKPDRYPFIIPITDTGPTATAAMSAIKHELETNEILNLDYGKIQFKKVDDITPEPSLESGEDWQARNVLLSNGVRIMTRSANQRIRGLRHYQHRPALILGDDIEDLKAVATQEKRDKTWKWWTGEVLPSLDEHKGRAILIGNWLHTDGLMARMKASGLAKVLEIPLYEDGEGPRAERVTWKAKYPTEAAIQAKEDELGAIAFAREMLLKVIPDEGQDVLPEDIHYYDQLPFDDGNYLAHGGDLAISTNESADCTALVTGEITWPDSRLEIYIQPNPLNRRMSFHETMDEFVHIRDQVRHTALGEYIPGMRLKPNQRVVIENGKQIVYASYTMASEWYIEAVAYQKAAIEEMERRGFSVQAMKPITDKRARLRVAARYIKSGVVKFPRKGCEYLLQQLLGFGVEKHDDLVDALVWLILGVANTGINPQSVSYVDRRI